jgi:tetratricopeptide (TPR) repeat protein
MEQTPASATAATADRPPALPERFEPRRFAGSGGCGAVWEVWDRWRGVARAAKLLIAPQNARKWRDLFYHEYALLFRLRHPGLIPAYDYGRTADDVPFFTMAWHDGPTLEEATWNAQDRPRLVWELLDTLSFIHRQGLIHADIKAANMKLDAAALRRPLRPEGERALVLLDFGLSVDTEFSEDRARRGTVHYMAPEWFKAGDVDRRIDLYSLGVLLFELYAGRTPFDADDPLVVVRQHLEAQPPGLRECAPDTPAPIAEAVARLLAKQPEIRDKGWAILLEYESEQFGFEPGSGPAALTHHFDSLGRHGRVVAAHHFDLWLEDASTRRLLYLRGGAGLEQECVLEGLMPDLCRRGFQPWSVDGPADPILQRSDTSNPQVVGLVAIRPETAEPFRRYLERWRSERIGPPQLAISIDADQAACRPLALQLATAVRSGEGLLVPVGPIVDAHARQLVQQALGDRAAPEEKDALVARACGNPSRLRALIQDRFEAGRVFTDAEPPGPAFSARLAEEQSLLREGWEPDELAAMSLLAAARTPVDRGVLRALADTRWTHALNLWLELGLVRVHSDRFEWQRPEIADALERTLSEHRRLIIHRAWFEYWASFSPEPGTDEHEHYTFHALRSDAYRRAVRAGLDNARYWTGEHQADKALEVLKRVETAMGALHDPAPSLVFELAVAQAEARRVLARYAQAAEHLRAALKHPAVCGQPRQEAEIYKRIGDLCKSLKRPAEGKLALEAALARYRGLGDKVEVSHVLNNIGNILYFAGDFDAALASYEEALTLQRELGLRRDVASTLNNIGGVLVLRSQFNLATRRLQEAVDIKRTLDDPEELARSLNNLAVAYMETGQFGLASEVVAESYDINVQTGKTGEQLFNLENMAQIAMTRGEWADAMNHSEAGLHLCSAAGSADGRLPFLMVMCGIEVAQGSYELVTVTLSEVDRILGHVQDPDLKLQRDLFGAEWAWWRNRAEETLKRADLIIDGAQAEKLPTWLARGYLWRARGLLLSAAEVSTARRWLEKSLVTAERIGTLLEQIQSRILLAELDARENKLELAADHLRRCEALILDCSAKPMFLPFAHTLGAYHQIRGDVEMALSVYDTARKLATNLALPEWVWRLLSGSGHLLLALRRYDEAVEHYRGAVEVLRTLVGKLAEADREAYLQGSEKIALEDGLRACYRALVTPHK